MISFEDFVRSDDIPIYQQIVTYIKRGIVSGKIDQDDELPSRRELSSILTVNPNTIQKAYRQLEEEHLIVSRTGAKSYVDLDDEKVKQLTRQLFKDDILHMMAAARQMGITKEKMIKMIGEYWEEV